MSAPTHKITDAKIGTPSGLRRSCDKKVSVGNPTLTPCHIQRNPRTYKNEYNTHSHFEPHRILDNAEGRGTARRAPRKGRASTRRAAQKGLRYCTPGCAEGSRPRNAGLRGRAAARHAGLRGRAAARHARLRGKATARHAGPILIEKE